MTSIDIEGRLNFTFDSNWFAVKWDDHPGYHEGLRKHGNTAAVDILAAHNSDQCWLFEVKDPRRHRISFQSTLADISNVVACKVRDSIASLCWAYERVSDKAIPRLLRACFLARGKGTTVVLWLEDVKAAEALAIKEQIGRLLRPWIIPRIIVTNRELFSIVKIDGLTVKSLPFP